MVWSNQRNKALQERAQRVIPGGMYGHMSTGLLPQEFPQFFQRGKGCRIWDADGNEYVDFMCAYGPSLLGYNDPQVDAAAAAQQKLGDALNGPGEVMVELAEAFVSLVSHADWAMFCKNGTDATTMAMVTARAHTGRRVILAAKDAYHGADPWCVPAPRSKGTLPEDRAHVAYYEYNNAQSLADAMKAHAGDVAAVFAVPFRHDVFRDQEAPDLEYAAAARRLCDETGALLVVDDIRAGFRQARDCSWSLMGIEPDLSCWGKCFANGHPISALLGAEHVREAARSIFVTGSFWFSAVPMAAGIETLRQIRDTDYLERLQSAGQALREGLARQAATHGFALRQSGPAQMPQIFFDEDPDFRIGYAWTAECLKHGAYFHPYHNMFLSAAHTPADIARALEATDQAFEAVRRRRDALQPAPQIRPVLDLLARA
ncbi:aminotransferase class III-fold pyridoxal phosphate-dependent enzyme [Variovorax sp. VaC1]|uniref:aminotransferase class III-fold pyridoxal phosphate-dependent enzyme n=1 Tax=Variovorax sp. VaC1 TaxID=3373132 RepID=UPI0037497CD0